jgi:molybdenum cofactor synthesis domain-containing protein
VTKAFNALVLTVSDRAAGGERMDTAGPAVRDMLLEKGFVCGEPVILPDEKALIEEALIRAADTGDVNLVLTVGGTGLSPRDVSPEAAAAVCERLVPGIPEAMRFHGLGITPRAMLSRSVAGIRKQTLIINLPGSKKAAVENLEAVIDTLEHGLEILLDLKDEHGRTHAQET